MIRLRGTVQLAAQPRGKGTVGIRAVLRSVGEEAVEWRGRIRWLAGRTVSRRLEVDLAAIVDGPHDLCLEATSALAGPVHWHDLRIESSDDGAVVPGSPATRSEVDPSSEAVAGSTSTPRFSILTPVHNPPLDILAETLDSVRAQTYANWELCLVDDGSTDPAVTAALERAVEDDERIHLRRRESAGGISVATNEALEMARGEFIALLDHDDVLVPDALATVVATLDRQPDTDMFYSDEELLADGGPNHVFTKPHWSPDLLRSQMYTCHLGVYRRAIAKEIGGFRSGFDGSQDFDFALRFTEKTPRVVHIPQILYRWRVHAGSSAGSTQAKPAAYPAARRAIAEHLERTGTRGAVHFGPWQGIYRVVHELPTDARVVVVATEERPPRLASALEDEDRSGVTAAVLRQVSGLADLSDQIRDADVVVLVGDDLEPLTHGWLSRLASFALQPGVAAVGARVVAPDGRVENGALAIEGGLPVPLLLGSTAADPGPLGIGLLPANCTAVAGVVAISTAALTDAGGLDPELGELAIADYCLRAVAAGSRVVSAPDVLLRRLGPGPVNDLDLLSSFRRRWSPRFASDPYLDQAAGWATLGETTAA